MNGLQSNARRAFLRPANPRKSLHTDSRIIGAILPVTIASTFSATAQWYVNRYAVSHHTLFLRFLNALFRHLKIARV